MIVRETFTPTETLLDFLFPVRRGFFVPRLTDPEPPSIPPEYRREVLSTQAG
jgi:hypothetical protein